MTLSLYVLAGSALGGLARYWLAIAVAAWLGPAFPWGTLLINVGGSFLIGLAGAASPAPTTRAFVMVGLCGGFTTFSSFSLQTLDLLQSGRPLPALAYVAASVLLCLLATWAGWALAAPPA